MTKNKELQGEVVPLDIYVYDLFKRQRLKLRNRILLCGPCNKLKSNRFTLSGLRRENKKLGYLKGA